MRLGRLLAIFGSVAVSCFAVYYGQPKTEVLAELGKPVSAITRSGREVMMYPAGVRIELEQGKVVVVQGMPVQEGPGVAAVTPPESAAAPAAAAAEKEEEPDEPALSPEEKRKVEEEEARAEKEWQEANAKARAEMEKAIGDLENLHAQAQHPPPPEGFDIKGFAMGLAVGWVLVLIALKIACKYWGAEVFWSGLMSVAAADVAAKAAVGFVLLKVLEMPMTFYADEAVGAVVMIIVLQRVSINRSLQQAVTITLTTKVFSIVVGSLLFMVVLAGF
jgi:hypothetical protein